MDQREVPQVGKLRVVVNLECLKYAHENTVVLGMKKEPEMVLLAAVRWELGAGAGKKRNSNICTVVVSTQRTVVRSRTPREQ